MDTRVHVEIDPEFRDDAIRKGYDVEPFDAILIYGPPWLFWHVRPLTGKHCAIIDLPPMFNVTVKS